jgi:hypothetical protein
MSDGRMSEKEEFDPRAKHRPDVLLAIQEWIEEAHLGVFGEKGFGIHYDFDTGDLHVAISLVSKLANVQDGFILPSSWFSMEEGKRKVEFMAKVRRCKELMLRKQHVKSKEVVAWAKEGKHRIA